MNAGHLRLWAGRGGGEEDEGWRRSKGVHLQQRVRLNGHLQNILTAREFTFSIAHTFSFL